MKLLLALLLTISSMAFGKKANKPEKIVLNDKNTISFNQAFTAPYITTKQLEIIQKSAANPDMELYIVLYTPGGSIDAGELFIDTIQALPNKVHTITIFAASMGYNLAQALNTRYILRSGTLMSHRARVSGISGQVPGEANTSINFI